MADYMNDMQKEEQVKEQGEYTPSVATEFLRETIKQKPVNKRKLVRRTVTTVIMAVVFGMVACLTFLILQPVINSWLNPEPKAEQIAFPEEKEEVQMDEFYLDDNQMKEEEIEEIREITVNDSTEKVQALLENIILDVHDYENMYVALKDLAMEAEKAVVTVTCVTQNVDWFQNTFENEKQSSGVILAENGLAYLVAVKDTGLSEAEIIRVTFCDGTEANGELLGVDKTTGIAVISIPFTNILISTKEIIKIANLGTSNGVGLRGTPVIALGSPAGIIGSVSYGMITSDGVRLDLMDADYKLLTTDIYGASSASGILVSLKGYVIGIIDNSYNRAEKKNIISAYGISELKKVIEKLSNGESRAHFGINGTDVPVAIQKEMNVPKGAFVTKVEMNSPAMSGGIQTGDIIVSVNDISINSYKDFLAVVHDALPDTILSVRVCRQAAEGYAEIDLEITLDEVK